MIKTMEKQNKLEDKPTKFTCQSCEHELPIEFQMKTEGYCYLCDPNITVEELLSPNPIQLTQ